MVILGYPLVTTNFHEMRGRYIMSRAHTFSARIALTGILLATVIAIIPFPSNASIARATNGVWWVATSGTAANPATNGSSCANPSFVGTTDAAIQSAIDAATAGDEVRICSGTFNISTTVNVDKALTVTGGGNILPILDGGKAHRIMKVGSGAPQTNTITGLHFRNGYVNEDNGGASIRQDGYATLTVTKSLFSDNVVTGAHGAGISLVADANLGLPGSFHISRSTFVNNKAVDGAGATVVGLQNNTSTISNSTFVRNSASRGGGGANGSFASLQISNSTFIDNSAGEGGGAFWSAASKGLLVAHTGAVATSGQLCETGGNTPIDSVSTDASCIDESGGDTVTTLSALNLGLFAPWGGGSYGYAITSGSTAIGAVAGANCPATDTRGVDRSGQTCDAGSFEFEAGAPSLSASSAVTLLKGRSINPAITFTTSGLTSPIEFRVASEVSDPLPPGTNFSTSTGEISGTPTENSSARSIIITATDSLGAVANQVIAVENCVLTQSNGSYLLTNANDLDLFRIGSCGFNSSYKMTADITVTGTWEPLVSRAAPFTGTLDGDSHLLSGITVSNAGETGFIPLLKNATVKNLALSLLVEGGSFSAGLAREAVNSTISNVHITGTVGRYNNMDSGGCQGGIAGETYGTTITRSSFEGTVDGVGGSWQGGIAGCPYADTVISKSWFKGTIKGAYNVGGIAGYLENSDIVDSYATGTIVATANEIGGLVGWQGGDVNTDSDNIAITRSYSSMELSGVQFIGGIIGSGTSTAMADSFWDASKSGASGLTPFGAITDSNQTQPDLSGLTQTQMKTRATFTAASWSIVDGWTNPASTSDVWGICDGNTMPFLLVEYTTDACLPYATPVPPTSPVTTPTPPSETPTQPSTEPTPSPTKIVERPQKTVTIPEPAVYQGGVVVMIGTKKAVSSVGWNGNSKIAGSVGKVKMNLTFAKGATNSSNRGAITAGSRFSIVLSGLRAGSAATTGLSTKVTSLSKATATTKGAVRATVVIPKNAKVGAQKLRISFVNKDGKTVTLWFGISIRK